ncbi:MAG: thermonuclease family protein, partial [Promethearchaeota archaeon]
MIKKSTCLFLLSLLIVLTGFFLNYFSINGKAWEIDQTGTATYIVDGDTLDVSSIGRIRLADIQCPEIGDPGSTEATQYLASLVYQKEVYVDVDDITGTDPYGRIVAVIYVYHNDTHLINVNKALLEAGHAEIWNFDNNEFNPYDWTLYVIYQSEPEPDPEPEPEPEPPPNNPPDDSPSDNPPPDDSNEDNSPSDDNSGNQWIPLAISITLGIGIAVGLVVLTGWLLVKYTDIGAIKSKEKLKKSQKCMISKEKIFRQDIEYNNDPIINYVISN